MNISQMLVNIPYMDDMGSEPPSFSVFCDLDIQNQGTETSNSRTARLPTVESPSFRNMEAVSVLFFKNNPLSNSLVNG